MTSLLAVAVVLVGALGAVNLAIGFAMIRKLRDLETRVAQAPSAEHVPQVGHRIDPFVAVTVDGGMLSQADLAGSDTLVALLSPGCGSCDDVLAQLAADSSDLKPVILIHTEEPEDEETVALVDKARGVGRVAVVPFGPVPKAFGVDSFPTVLLVRDGTIRAAGYDLHEITSPVGRH